MANPVEQFTAPGKYEIDLFFEKARKEEEYEREKSDKEEYIGIQNAYFNLQRLFKNNIYESFSNSQSKFFLIN